MDEYECYAVGSHVWDTAFHPQEFAAQSGMFVFQLSGSGALSIFHSDVDSTCCADLPLFINSQRGTGAGSCFVHGHAAPHRDA